MRLSPCGCLIEENTLIDGITYYENMKKKYDNYWARCNICDKIRDYDERNLFMTKCKLCNKNMCNDCQNIVSFLDYEEVTKFGCCPDISKKYKHECGCWYCVEHRENYSCYTCNKIFDNCNRCRPDVCDIDNHDYCLDQCIIDICIAKYGDQYKK